MLVIRMALVWSLIGQLAAGSLSSDCYEPMPMEHFDASKGFPGEGPGDLFQGLQAIWLRRAREKAPRTSMAKANTRHARAHSAYVLGPEISLFL